MPFLHVSSSSSSSSSSPYTSSYCRRVLISSCYLVLYTSAATAAFLSPSTTTTTTSIPSHVKRFATSIDDVTPPSSPTNTNLAPPTTTTPNNNAYVQFNHPTLENCEIILLGVLHGSSSSVSDVESILLSSSPTPSIVVLELCASRFVDMRRDPPSQPRDTFTLQRYINMVSRTIRRRGFSTGIAAAILGGVSGVQTALSGFEPGIEFRTAIAAASSSRSDIILADQEVGETLRRVGDVPSLAWKMLRDANSIAEQTKSLKEAVWGVDEETCPQQVDMGKVLRRNDAVKQDLVLLTLPPLALVSLFSLVFDTILSGKERHFQVWLDLIPSLNHLDVLSIVTDVVTSVGILGVGFILLALPVSKVIISERDDQLAEGVERACQIAMEEEEEDDEDRQQLEKKRVVAVLGLLHVNGVARRLLKDNK